MYLHEYVRCRSSHLHDCALLGVQEELAAVETAAADASCSATRSSSEAAGSREEALILQKTVDHFQARSLSLAGQCHPLFVASRRVASPICALLTALQSTHACFSTVTFFQTLHGVVTEAPLRGGGSGDGSDSGSGRGGVSADLLRRQLAAAESLQITATQEAGASQRLLEQLLELDSSMTSIGKALETVAETAVAEDEELQEFYEFKQMLQELQMAVRDSRAASQQGGGEEEVEGTPSAIKNSAAFKKAGAVLRGWIDRFDCDEDDEGVG